MIGEIIADFEEAVTLRRFAAGTLTKGRNAPGAMTTSTIRCAVVPATGRDLLRLPEGSRTSETKRVFSATSFNTNPPDEIVYRGVKYEVKDCADWENNGGFFDSLVQRKVDQS